MDAGEIVPEFSLPDQDGVERSLSGLLAAGPIALFFYPAAMTKGCTAESCHFRDLAAQFATLGAGRVGISADPVATQLRFAQTYGLDYPLLSDADGQVSRIFGVRRSIGPLRTKRWTFVIAPDRSVLGVIRNELRMDVHADRALALLREYRAS